MLAPNGTVHMLPNTSIHAQLMHGPATFIKGVTGKKPIRTIHNPTNTYLFG